MSPVVIFLAIIVIVLVYFLLVLYILPSGKTLVSTVDLSKGSKTIEQNSVTASNIYYFSTWVYVKSWNNTTTKTIISQGSETTGTQPCEFKLYLDAGSPSLKCDVRTTGNNDKGIILTNNFPIQKWCQIAVSVDNNTLDFYMDGRLVLSKKLTAPAATSQSSITMGDSGNPDIQLAMVKRDTVAIDPRTALNEYLAGNGQSTSAGKMNVKLSILRDDVEQKKFSLF
jgi:hypothetical protein